MRSRHEDTLPVGTLVCVTGDDFFATCAGNIGIVVGHRVSKLCDWHLVLVGSDKILARADQLTLVAVGHSEQ